MKASFVIALGFALASFASAAPTVPSTEALAAAPQSTPFGASRAKSTARPKPQTEQCVVCHGKEGHELSGSIHAKAELHCTSCHGGNPTAIEVATAHGKELKKLSTPREALESCGTCHADVQRMRLYGQRTDQLSLYWTSKHGEKLAKDGDANVATCISCHGVHDVLKANDTRSPVHPFNQAETCGRCHGDAQKMAPYGLDSKVVDEYRTSLHGRALMQDSHQAAPACATCHGSHGAAPPRVGDIEQVCGNCHSVVQEHYDESPHAIASKNGKSVQCVSCHGSHTIAPPSPAMFLGDEDRHCGSCHADAKDPARKIGSELHEGVTGLERVISEAEEELRRAAGRGLFLGAEKGYLDDARGLLVRARASTHRASSDAQTDILNRGQAMVLQTRESLATKARTFRDRKIFTTIFGALTLVFAIVLLMYGRTIGGTWKKGAPGSKARGDVNHAG
ncbi:MAG: hypothetical protein IPJ77_21775 [Planctomycetes bacterium]|nr:hypothetical protein [Planctomycetota bacterium]